MMMKRLFAIICTSIVLLMASCHLFPGFAERLPPEKDEKVHFLWTFGAEK